MLLITPLYYVTDVCVHAFSGGTQPNLRVSPKHTITMANMADPAAFERKLQSIFGHSARYDSRSR